jgi:hypothetical protein
VPAPPRHRGFTLWLVLVVLGGAVAAIGWVVREAPDDVGALVALAVGALLAAVGLAQAWRRDAHDVLLLLAGAGGICGVIRLVLYAFVPQAGGPGALAVGLAGAVASLLGGGTYAYWQRRRPGLPNLLIDEYGKEHIYERGGVQLTFVDFPEELPVGEVAEIVLSLQSVVDAPRTIKLTFTSSKVRMSTRRHLVCAELEVHLAPGEVVAAWVPITPAALARGHAELTPIVKISGPPARRLRWWRAEALPQPMSLVMQLLAVLVGEFGALKQSGLKIELRIPSQEDEEQEAELPLASAETIWTREGGHVELAADEEGGDWDEDSDDHGLEGHEALMDGPDPFADADAPDEHR